MNIKKTLFFWLVVLFSCNFFARGKNLKQLQNGKKDCNSSQYFLNLAIDNSICLFSMPSSYYDSYLRFYGIIDEFVKKQKILKGNFVGKPVFYVLYKLEFFNSMVKIYCYDVDYCSGYLFYDYSGKRLLFVRTVSAGKEKEFKENMDDLDFQLCKSIEYFDLKNGTYEFSGNLPLDFVLKKEGNYIKIEVKIPENLFPGIDKDYCFKASIKIDDKLKKYFERVKVGAETVTEFYVENSLLDLVKQKEFKKMVEKTGIRVIKTTHQKEFEKLNYDKRKFIVDVLENRREKHKNREQ